MRSREEEDDREITCVYQFNSTNICNNWLNTGVRKSILSSNTGGRNAVTLATTYYLTWGSLKRISAWKLNLDLNSETHMGSGCYNWCHNHRALCQPQGKAMVLNAIVPTVLTIFQLRYLDGSHLAYLFPWLLFMPKNLEEEKSQTFSEWLASRAMPVLLNFLRCRNH